MGVIPTAGGGVSYELVTASDIGAIPATEKGAANGVATLDGTGKVPTGQIPSLGANPSATIGLTATNGVASTYLRSDGAPALSQAITPTWTAAHTWQGSAGTKTTVIDGDSIAQSHGYIAALDTANAVGLPGSTGTFLTAGNGIEQVIFQNMGLSAGNRRVVFEQSGGAGFVGFMNDQTGGRTAVITWLGGAASGVTGLTSNSGSGAWAHTGAFSISGAATLTGGVGSYLGIATQGAGLSSIYAVHDAVTQAANIAATTLFAVPTGKGGMYRVSAYAVVTQAATTSSTLPNVGVLWTDSDSSVALSATTVTPTNTANAVGAFGPGDIVIYAKEGTNIQFQTSNYASSGATPMQYAVHLKLEFLG